MYTSCSPLKLEFKTVFTFPWKTEENGTQGHSNSDLITNDKTRPCVAAAGKSVFRDSECLETKTRPCHGKSESRPGPDQCESQTAWHTYSKMWNMQTIGTSLMDLKDQHSHEKTHAYKQELNSSSLFNIPFLSIQQLNTQSRSICAEGFFAQVNWWSTNDPSVTAN